MTDSTTYLNACACGVKGVANAYIKSHFYIFQSILRHRSVKEF